MCSNDMLLNCITPLMSACVSTLLLLIVRELTAYKKLFSCLGAALFFFVSSTHYHHSACQAISDATSDPLTHISQKHMYTHSPLSYTWTLIHWNLRQCSTPIKYFIQRCWNGCKDHIFVGGCEFEEFYELWLCTGTLFVFCVCVCRMCMCVFSWWGFLLPVKRNALHSDWFRSHDAVSSFTSCSAQDCRMETYTHYQHAHTKAHTHCVALCSLVTDKQLHDNTHVVHTSTALPIHTDRQAQLCHTHSHTHDSKALLFSSGSHKTFCILLWIIDIMSTLFFISWSLKLM